MSNQTVKRMLEGTISDVEEMLGLPTRGVATWPRHSTIGWHNLRKYLRTLGPYCIQNDYVLNREYKPLGVPNYKAGHVNYAEYPHCKLDSGAPRPDFDPLFPPAQNFYLFQDGTAPWGNRKACLDYLNNLKQWRDRL